jgi:hypothetical protein
MPGIHDPDLDRWAREPDHRDPIGWLLLLLVILWLVGCLLAGGRP